MTNVTGMFDNLTKLGNFLPESNDESYTRPKPLNQSGPKKKKKWVAVLMSNFLVDLRGQKGMDRAL